MSLHILDPEVLHSQYLVLFHKESIHHLNPTSGFLQRTQQGYISVAQRRELVDWIYQVWNHFKYQSTESFHLAINFLDRICSIHPVHIKRYQILGAACFWIASKFTEPDPPSFTLLASLAGGAFKADTLKAEELLVLKRLKWNLSVATPCSFLELLLMFLPTSAQHRHTLYQYGVSFLCAMPLSYHMMQYAPSVQSAAALFAVFAATGSDCEFCYHFLAQHIRRLSMDSSAMAMGLQPPSMRDIDACANEMMVIVRQTFPEFQFANDPSVVMRCIQHERHMTMLQQRLYAAQEMDSLASAQHHHGLGKRTAQPISIPFDPVLYVSKAASPSLVSPALRLTAAKTAKNTLDVGRVETHTCTLPKSSVPVGQSCRSPTSAPFDKTGTGTPVLTFNSDSLWVAASPLCYEGESIGTSDSTFSQPPTVIAESDDPEYADFSFISSIMPTSELEDACLSKTALLAEDHTAARSLPTPVEDF
ncbi:hypothetical protein BASA50_008541 [Batrachochytrium salamandrivorans]|uniref:Cyclin-like domain-containing protein n=1 Tax=Batrachochytrium salamandrivorans TaxID=1357716 RepID=A0ABQ8F4D2_9FUNG|nr:hypothetical protein BASA60_009065 [Batrachochytrium salamandrivorans]KAH6578014.1 hypothetical protein BASA62_000538 [Batrachochytrium salamandrivorans]KAH6589515.1 hypothetical protein BASA61_005578 [Batrachochytrium salamandrivorans]KAH6591684.1 hypothetical protein BASA50_008541 [Batrachochytrium salamandrivorans]KAH9245533.1 hypothetical protein BASA81_016979 [Batrachochytrium salamandrivorans]